MATITDKELETEFSRVGLTLEDVAINDKLKEVCAFYNWSSSHVVDEWIAFSQAQVELSMKAVEEFRRKLSSDQRSKPNVVKIEPSFTKIYNKDTIDEFITEQEMGMLEMYETPETKTSVKRLRTTPESGNKMLHTSSGRTPMVFSPAGISPASGTPAKRYEARENAGEVVFTYNPNGVSERNIAWKGHHENLQINCIQDQPLTERFRYMFQKITDKSQVLNEIVDELALLLKETHKIEEFSSVSSIHQEDATVVGRVCCDTNGRLNASSLVLRESGSSSSGMTIHLNVSDVNQYTLFPGQVVAVKGKNPTGTQFIASSFYEGVLPHPYELESFHAEDSAPSFFLPSSWVAHPPRHLHGIHAIYMQADGNDLANLRTSTSKGPTASETYDSLSVFVAAGPYTTSESNSYQPLSDFLNRVLEEKPDLVIMVGPFVDAKHELIERCELNESFQELFAHKMNKIGDYAKRINSTEFIIIPSQRDVNHDMVYPQPPFSAMDIRNTLMNSAIHENKNAKPNQINALKFLSDPCTVSVNGFTFGLTSTDVLFHLGSEEIAHPPGSSDKMGRLVKHILTQQCYYPLYPPCEEVCVDYEAFARHARLPCKPDVLFVPSDLRYFAKQNYGLSLKEKQVENGDKASWQFQLSFKFVKNVMGCLSVNPGRLSKGLVGGTYCRMLLKKDRALRDVIDRSVVQIVKI